MCTIGHMGLDAYVDGSFWSCVYPHKEGKMEGWFFQNASKKMRQITIYLPLYTEVKIENIILDDEAEIGSATPFSIKQPVVFYGTSITQGGCASRAGLSYQAMLCRDLNIDFINLGFSGSGKGEAIIARELTEIDAACYVLDYGQNNESIKGFESVYYQFISEIRKVKTRTPILLTTPIFYTQENWDSEYLDMQNHRREIIRKAFQKCIDEGDKNIYLVEWNKIISLEDGDGQVDGYHPNDLGFYRMSMGIKDIIKQVLAIS
jgi:lysophospholipase L1-like esterase